MIVPEGTLTVKTIVKYFTGYFTDVVYKLLYGSDDIHRENDWKARSGRQR